MRIDAHQHFWRPERADYGWLTPAKGLLYRAFGPADLEPLLRAARIDRTVLVQAAPTEAETEYMLGIADATAWVAGVVGWLDLEALTFPERLDRFNAHPKFLGIRPMLQDLEDDRFILRAPVLTNLGYVASTGTPFDFLTFPRHLAHVASVLEQVPNLRAVVDHISKPAIAAGTLDPWRADIAAVAKFDGVCCKVSGMVTEADLAQWTRADLEPYVLHVLDVFGPDRLIYGSDWPVCLLAADYARVIGTLEDILAPRLSASEMAAVFGGNAARFYRIEG